MKVYDLKKQARDAAATTTDAKNAAKMQRYNDAAFKVMIQKKDIRTWGPTELINVLSFYMKGSKHTTIGKNAATKEERKPFR